MTTPGVSVPLTRLRRTIMSEHFGSLALPVGEFLALEHGTEYHGCGRSWTRRSADAYTMNTPCASTP